MSWPLAMCGGVLKLCHQWVVIGVLTGALAAAPVLADSQDGWYGDIRQFHERDYSRWRSGHWAHTFHFGRGGWWWVIGRDWYSYPAPIYPYPDPYAPPGAEAGSAPSSGTQYWYYCSLPVGYYPYVNFCRHPWRRVVSLTVTVPPQTAAAQTAAVPLPVNPHDNDNRQVRGFAAELEGIHVNDLRAADRLTDLLRRVKSFHKELQRQNHSAPEVLKDTEKLENRIADKRSQVNRLAPRKRQTEHARPAPASVPSASPTSSPKTKQPIAPPAAPAITAAPSPATAPPAPSSPAETPPGSLPTAP
jgi:hypothetical protein